MFRLFFTEDQGCRREASVDAFVDGRIFLASRHNLHHLIAMSSCSPVLLAPQLGAVRNPPTSRDLVMLLDFLRALEELPIVKLFGRT